MTWQLTVASRVAALGWTFQQRLKYFISNCAISFIALENAAACRAERDSGIWSSGVTKSREKSCSFSHPAAVQLGKGEKPQESRPAGARDNCTRSSCSRNKKELLASAVLHCKEPCLAPEGGFTHLLWVLEGVRRLTVHGRNRKGSVPTSTRLPWTEQVTSPAPARPRRLRWQETWHKPEAAVKTMAGKKPISKITLYFFVVVEFTLMYCNLKGPGKTTCKRVSK